mmetsp:Transcript_15487/g.36983  ORF Transcript_15487/g.36983 Transcript_15487/m.36983 type:complete len:97 (+) Transcript_15487:1342-1632(+)
MPPISWRCGLYVFWPKRENARFIKLARDAPAIVLHCSNNIFLFAARMYCKSHRRAVIINKEPILNRIFDLTFLNGGVNLVNVEKLFFSILKCHSQF